jgi:hypothetical protein
MYSGALVMLFGTPLALGSLWGLIVFIPMTLVIVWRFLDEEKFLLRNLAGYAEYCEIVRYADRIDKVEVNSSRAVMIPTTAFQSLKTERSAATESKPKNDEAEEEINS